LDFPPIFYQNDTSRAIINIVTKYNQYHKTIKAGYTFDAGPNAVIFALEQDISQLLDLISYYYPPPKSTDRLYYISSRAPEISVSLMRDEDDLVKFIGKREFVSSAASLKHIIHTKVGPGPREVEGDSLLDNEGNPKAC